MKKLVLIIIAILAILGLLKFLSHSKPNSTIVQYRHNPELTTINSNPGWKGTPVNSKGEFVNLHTPFNSSLMDLLRWQLSPNPQKKEKKNDQQRLKVENNEGIFHDTQDAIVWLGHASFLIRLNGITFLTDPVFLENPFLKRYANLPFSIENLGQIDYVLLSHDHRDHCDEKTLKYIYGQNPKLKILTGLNMTPLLQKWMPGIYIQEAGWYQQFQTEGIFSISYVPTRHWSKRGLFDENERLWGGFFIKYATTSVYFMGDSGFDEHFQDIRNICGTPEYALMGIGAYKPEWFMHQAHMSPLDALKAFELMKGKYFIPMHYGTFDLSDEPLLEPLRILEERSPAGLLPLNVGQVHHLAASPQ